MNPQLKGDPNSASAVLLLQACEGEHRGRILFPGDARVETLRRAQQYFSGSDEEAGLIPCDVLVAPHHGGAVQRGSRDDANNTTRCFGRSSSSGLPWCPWRPTTGTAIPTRSTSLRCLPLPLPKVSCALRSPADAAGRCKLSIPAYFTRQRVCPAHRTLPTGASRGRLRRDRRRGYRSVPPGTTKVEGPSPRSRSASTTQCG